MHCCTLWEGAGGNNLNTKWLFAALRSAPWNGLAWSVALLLLSSLFLRNSETESTNGTDEEGGTSLRSLSWDPQFVHSTLNMHVKRWLWITRDAVIIRWDIQPLLCYRSVFQTCVSKKRHHHKKSKKHTPITAPLAPCQKKRNANNFAFQVPAWLLSSFQFKCIRRHKDFKSLLCLNECYREEKEQRGKIGWERCFYFPGSTIRMNVWLCCVRLVSPLCLYVLSYLYFMTTGLLKRVSKYISHNTAWLITTKYKGNEQNAIRTNCSGRSRSLRSLCTSLWNCSHVPSASENGLQQSTVWTGWQDGLMLEENTRKPNNNRFHPSNSHLLCHSGLEQRTLPPTCHSVCRFGVQCAVLWGECNKVEHWEGS